MVIGILGVLFAVMEVFEAVRREVSFACQSSAFSKTSMPHGIVLLRNITSKPPMLFSLSLLTRVQLPRP